METRQKTEYRVYILELADVRGGVDKAVAIAAFDELDKLKEFYNSQREDWKDEPSPDFYGNVHGYNKAFKKDSMLEWYNPLKDFNIVSYQDAAFGGVTEQWWDAFPCQENSKIPFNPTAL